jgi:hypothetical protein
MKRPVVFRIILYLAIVVISYFIVRLNLPNPKEQWNKDTALAVYEYMLRQIGEKPLGKEIYEVTKSISEKEEVYKLPEYAYFYYGDLPVPIVEPANLQDAHKLVERMRRDTAELLRLAREGVMFPSEESVKEWLEKPEKEETRQGKGESYSPTYSAKLMPYDFMVKSLRIESQMRAIEGDWRGAIQSLEDIVTLSRSIRYNYMMGHLIATLELGLAGGGFERMMLVNHTPEVDRQALLALNTICAKPMQLDQLTMLSEELMWIFTAAKGPYPVGSGPGYDANAVLGLIAIKDVLQRPENRKWLERNRDRFVTRRFSGDEESAYNKIVEVEMMPFGWTLYPSIQKYMRRIGETETELMNSVSVIKGLGDKLPPALRTKLFVGMYVPQYNLGEAVIRTYVSCVNLEVVRIAFAMRLFHHDKGNYPANVQELIPDYLSDLPVLPFDQNLLKYSKNVRDPNGMLSPIRITRVELDARGVCSALKIPVRSGRLWEARRNVATLSNNGILEWQSLPEKEAQVMVEYLKSFGKAVKEVSVYAGQDRTKNVRAALNLPHQTLALYSPGPDGDDDGGKVQYDPTNGTVSDGDIIVYPGGFSQ